MRSRYINTFRRTSLYVVCFAGLSARGRGTLRTGSERFESKIVKVAGHRAELGRCSGRRIADKVTLNSEQKVQRCIATKLVTEDETLEEWICRTDNSTYDPGQNVCVES